MPSLEQVANFAYQHLKKSLKLYDYTPIEEALSLQKHNKRSTEFCSCIDKFGAKYWLKSDINHPYNSIRVNFRYIVDKEGKKILQTRTLLILLNRKYRYIYTKMHNKSTS